MKISCVTSTGSSDLTGNFQPFALKMEEQGMPPIVINVFKCFYAQLLYGAQGKLAEEEITPVDDHEVRPYDELKRYGEAGMRAMDKAVVIKLNGGLGTSMGLEKAKSLITVKDDLNFLDIIIRQVKKLRKAYDIPLPLVFMNSFKTHMDTMMRAKGFDNGSTEIPLAFVQHRYPKVLEMDNAPAVWPRNPELEWNPPGHGDIYTAMITSKILQQLLNRGYRYAFISNSDNLGAIMDENILGYMAVEGIPFLMEVARRTQSDRKGGHLARLKKSGRLVLREVAQCKDNEMDMFSDIERHRFFNTNSLWLDLQALEKVFVENRMMPLDIIINPKTLDPRDGDSPRVLQVETAMGSAISNFDNAAAIEVPRRRFAPVKNTNDLLLVMSDRYVLTEADTVEPSPKCETPMPHIELDPGYYKKIDDFLARFPDGAPSLLKCTGLKVVGDVLFEKDVRIHGQTKIVNKTYGQATVHEGQTVSGEVAAG